MTAIEWLYCQLIDGEIHTDTNQRHMIFPRDAFKKAMEMEKQQIIDAHIDASELGGFEASAEDWANRYFNETYKNK